MSSILTRVLSRSCNLKSLVLNNKNSNRFLSLTSLKRTDEFKIGEEEERKKYDHVNDEKKLKEEILKNAMKYVPIYGFSVQSILEGDYLNRFPIIYPIIYSI